MFYADNDDVRSIRIKELEQLQSKYEAKIADWNYKILKGAQALDIYKSVALHYWQKDEELFDAFMEECITACNIGNDITPILEKHNLIDEHKENVHIVMLRVALQDLYLDKEINNLKEIIQKLMLVNKELNNLKS